jgi:hypothetical protein
MACATEGLSTWLGTELVRKTDASASGYICDEGEREGAEGGERGRAPSRLSDTLPNPVRPILTLYYRNEYKPSRINEQRRRNVKDTRN